MGEYNLVAQALVGADHRLGWPAVVASLKAGSTPAARLLLDDFVERTFTYPDGCTVYTQPWVGIFHHTPRMPIWMPHLALPQSYFRSSRFLASLPHLKGVVTLCEYSAKWFREQLGVPAIAIHYPIPDLGITWRPTLHRKVWQFGWYLRNTMLLDQIHVPQTRIRPRLSGAAAKHEARVEAHWRQRGTRKTYDGVKLVDRLENSAYDNALQSDLVVVEYFDVGASTLVMECLSAATPLAVGYHPALAEVLGDDYPFYADGPDHFAALLTNEDAIMDAHLYLRARRSDAGNTADFVFQLNNFIGGL